LIVGAVSWFMVDRITQRAAQIATNDMHAEFNPRNLVYTIGIVVVYSILYWLFVKDVFGRDRL
jgi:hypothetical protein